LWLSAMWQSRSLAGLAAEGKVSSVQCRVLKDEWLFPQHPTLDPRRRCPWLYWTTVQEKALLRLARKILAQLEAIF
jgi:hypothetical protein